MHLAVGNDDIRTVVLLLRKGAPIDARDKGNNTPLHLATLSVYMYLYG